ncbi:MAG: alpha/beta fold hydrolase [Lamprobacter sp.]|uniref:alpha/beta fold hydrolase n=1 Tax=Lamprobacter sp. TaxID=3100796 RepID=UPI002B25B92D|nr:alpha/beta fold hydrolase [Lamprobacter sp.]MEA3641629.1 alpha/beta fold hydrolase [Lamprobacter sp.]
MTKLIKPVESARTFLNGADPCSGLADPFAALAEQGFRALRIGGREADLPPRSLLLHGFTGLAEDWRHCWPTTALRSKRKPGPELEIEPAPKQKPGPASEPRPEPRPEPALAIDLPGHGGSVAPEGAFDEALHRLLAVLPASIDRVVGYSLGGRLALGLLRLAPQRFRTAIILSAHPGLADPQARTSRRAADQRWIERLEQQGIAAFVEAWEALPLLATQSLVPASRLARQREQRLSQSATGLAASLSVHGLAEMPNMRETIIQYPGELHWVAGAEDAKFSALACEVERWRPSLRLHLLPGVGHNPLLEAPEPLRTIMLPKLAST